ncbi:lysophospholipid acyltransferase family protein [Acidobacteriota bacterium]
MIVLYSLYAWLIGGLYVLLICLTVLFLSLFLNPRKFDPLLKAMCRSVFYILFIRVRREGTEHIQQNCTYLFMANHVNIFDIPMLEGFTPTYVRAIEAQRQFKWPVYGWVIRRLGNIPIDRKNIHSSIKSMKRAEEFVHTGKSLFVLPEGHRTPDGKLQPFKRLPFHLAKQAGIPIIPVGLSGLYRVKQVGSYLIRPSSITIRFGEPIDIQTIESVSADELSDLVRERIKNLIQE